MAPEELVREQEPDRLGSLEGDQEVRARVRQQPGCGGGLERPVAPARRWVGVEPSILDGEQPDQILVAGP
jgi:hypothetical protein